MNNSEFCRDCIFLPKCQEVEEEDSDTTILDCDYKKED